jgi:hypothetical protein
MDPDDAGRAVLLVVPTLLLAAGVGATLAVGTPPRVLLPGAAAMLVVAGALYHYAGQVVGLGRGPDEMAADEESTDEGSANAPDD